MFRWQGVSDQTIFDMTVKMYRDPFVAADVFTAPFIGAELDHYAYVYLDSELFTYKILDVNFDAYIEERGDLDRFTPVRIPTRRDSLDTIF